METNQPQEQQQQPQQNQQPKNYNPFIENVSEKPYTQMNVGINSQQIQQGIPEPYFQPNTIRANENAYNMLKDDLSSNLGQSQGGGSAPFNPTLNNLSEADKQKGAEHLAKIIIDGYEQIHVFANKGLQISEKKVRKMVAEGEIDLSVQIPYDYGKTISAGEFIQDFNEQNKDTLTVSKEFKKDVTPVLTRVLAKRGASLTDEQMLMFLFGKDILVKGVIFTQIRGTMTDMVEVIKEYTIAVRENGGVPTQPMAANPTPPPPPPPPAPPSSGAKGYEPRPRPVTPVNTDDFNFRENETFMDSSVVKHNVPDSGKARLMAQRKRDKEIQAAMKRAEEQSGNKRSSYADAMSKKKTGKRGRKPKNYVVPLDEEQIAEAIILSETKEYDKNAIKGLD